MRIMSASTGAAIREASPADEIPLAARMISIADTYDVMTSRDSYRKPVSPKEAIAELRRVSGSQLDAKLVEIFIELVEQQTIRLQAHGRC